MSKGKAETQEEYRQRVMEVVCGCLAQGKPLVQILALEDMPSYATVMRWLTEDATLQENYMRAREASADYLADEIVTIADTELDPQVARVRIDARKWVAAKMKPKKYGDKMTLAGDPENPLSSMTDEQLLARLERLRK